MRKFNISNAEKRDAEVAFEQKATRTKTSYKTAEGSDTHSEKRLRSTMETEPDTLLAQYHDNLANVLVAEDPEIDLEKVGLKLEGLKKVYLTDEGKVAYGVTLNEHVFNPDGTEKEIRPESSTTGNIAVDGMPVRWTGKMMPKADAMRRFVFKKHDACRRRRQGHRPPGDADRRHYLPRLPGRPRPGRQLCPYPSSYKPRTQIPLISWKSRKPSARKQ